MSKRIIILLLILIAVIAVLLFMVARPKNDILKQEQTSTKTTTTIKTPASLFLEPASLNVSSSSGTIDVVIESGDYSVNSVQFGLSYDPTVITSVTVENGTYFQNPLVLLNKVNQSKGTITYTIGIQPNGIPPTGEGVLAKIRFRANYREGKSTRIEFSGVNSVYGDKDQENSILEETGGATIIFGLAQQTTQPVATQPAVQY